MMKQKQMKLYKANQIKIAELPPLIDAYWTWLSPVVRSTSSKLQMFGRTSKRTDSAAASTSLECSMETAFRMRASTWS